MLALVTATVFLLFNNLTALVYLCPPKAMCPGICWTQQMGKDKTFSEVPGSWSKHLFQAASMDPAVPLNLTRLDPVTCFSFFSMVGEHEYMVFGIKVLDMSLTLTLETWVMSLTWLLREMRPSLAVQWLRFHLPMQDVLGSIPGWGLRLPHVSWPKKQKHRGYILTNSMKSLKMVHIKTK